MRAFLVTATLVGTSFAFLASDAEAMQPQPRTIEQLQAAFQTNGIRVTAQSTRSSLPFIKAAYDLKGPGIWITALQFDSENKLPGWYTPYNGDGVQVGRFILTGLNYEELVYLRKIYDLGEVYLSEPFDWDRFKELPFEKGYAELNKLQQNRFNYVAGIPYTYAFSDGTLEICQHNMTGSTYTFRESGMSLDKAVFVSKILAKSNNIDFSNSKNVQDGVKYESPSHDNEQPLASVVIKTDGKIAKQVTHSFQYP